MKGNRMIRPGILVAITLLAAVSNCQGQSFHTAKAKSPDAGSVFIYPERIPLKAGGMFSAERGLMFVPLNRSRQTSDVIAVEFYRFPRSDAAKPETLPIFILSGGPGFEGLEKNLSRLGNFEQQWQPMLDMSDVIIVGQRGIGSSKPNTLIDQTVPQQPVDQAYDDAQAVSDLQRVLRSEKAFWESTGVDLSGFTVLEAATDVRDVSQALGYKQIVILGGSFGSHWGMAIMRQFPNLVARAVLNGMEGPDHTYDHPQGYWNVFQRVAEEAESDQELKDLIPEGGLINAIERLVARARQEPFVVTIDGGESSEKKILIDGPAMQRLASGYSGGLRAWPADVINMHNGNFESAARRMYMRSRSAGRDFGTASFWMLDCGSGITARRLAEYQSAPAQEIIGSTYWVYAAGCPIWNSDLGDEFRQNFETEIPTVIVHGTWDLSTPYENALELAPYFKNSKLVTIRRGSHNAITEAFNAHPTFKTDLMRFVVSGEMPDLPNEIQLPAIRWVIPKK